MKVLSTDQQMALRELLESLESSNVETQSELNYWKIELKPKRTRKIKTDDVTEFINAL